MRKSGHRFGAAPTLCRTGWAGRPTSTRTFPCGLVASATGPFFHSAVRDDVMLGRAAPGQALSPEPGNTDQPPSPDSGNVGPEWSPDTGVPAGAKSPYPGVSHSGRARPSRGVSVSRSVRDHGHGRRAERPGILLRVHTEAAGDLCETLDRALGQDQIGGRAAIARADAGVRPG